MQKQLKELEARLTDLARHTSAMIDQLTAMAHALQRLQDLDRQPGKPQGQPVQTPLPLPRDEGKLYLTLPSPWRYIFHRKPDILEGAVIARTLGMKPTTFFRAWREAGFPKPVKNGVGRGNKALWSKADVIRYLEDTTGEDRLPPILPSFEKGR